MNLSNDRKSTSAKAINNTPSDFASTFQVPVIMKINTFITSIIPPEKELHCINIPPMIFQLYVVSIRSAPLDRKTSGLNRSNQIKTATLVAKNIAVPNIDDINSQSISKFPMTCHPDISLPKTGIKTICYNMLSHVHKRYKCHSRSHWCKRYGKAWRKGSRNGRDIQRHVRHDEVHRGKDAVEHQGVHQLGASGGAGARQVPPDIRALPLKGRVPGKHTLYPRREKEQDGRGLSQGQGALLRPVRVKGLRPHTLRLRAARSRQDVFEEAPIGVRRCSTHNRAG